ncbi:hypothetical protein BZZ01_09840 [Nostocales cyanobacterium HT-58-2]|nr:hypothetical protein BZZ01_09840 [Nostocales cyanobacterium HT-58-2]
MSKKNIQDIYPLSPAQQGILFHTLYNSESRVYFDQLSCYLHGDLNIPLFKQAWQQIVEQHPILRTAFIWQGHKDPFQVVYQSVEIPWEEYDWIELSSVDQQERLEAFLEADRQKGFQLSQAPLIRCTLIRLSEDIYDFIWSYHHLVMDGWSLGLVLNKVSTLYKAFCQRREFHVEYSRPYRDYIAWLQQQDLSKAEAFWRKTLKDFTTPTHLDVGKTLRNSFSQAETYTEYLQLSQAATTALQSFARQHQLTLNTLVQAAWALLLSRYTNEQDVIFGSVVSGRPVTLAGVESMVGVFINTLPMRVQVSPQVFLLDWLKQLQAQQVELRQYEYTPLVEIQGWSDVSRGLSLFDTIVAFENYPIDASLQEQIGGLKISNIRSSDPTNYPLSMVAIPGSELSLQLAYHCQKFDATTVRQMLRHLQTLLESMIANPQQRLADLSLLTTTERQQLLVEWNCNHVDDLLDICIHQLFETQVEQIPEAVAVVLEDQYITYQELNRRANCVAHYLRSLGVIPDVFVGLYLERSLEMIIGILGILKAGGVYLPLDPAYPQERLSFMLADAQVQVLLTKEQLVDQLPQQTAKVVCLDTDEAFFLRESSENPVLIGTIDNLAYTIYTSGSTGKPKGVMISHRAIANYCQIIQRHYQLTPLDNVLQFASLNFDGSVEQILPTLITGAKLVLRGKDIWTITDFHKRVADFQISVADLPTAYWHYLVQKWAEAPNLVARHNLRLITLGGDLLQPESIQTWQQTPLHSVRLLNGYGPTEATIAASTFVIPAFTQDLPLKNIPIGRPIAGKTVYILDKNNEPVPIGVPGELHIGGLHLSRGYLNHSKLTAERFIPDPFGNESGTRLYKTGDRACYLPDGNIQFLGRFDNQIKIRGFRIELGEIEAVLNQHPAVQEAVVIARKDEPDNVRLVAYAVVNQKLYPTISISELYQFLQQQLPDYMMPATIMLLEALPRTPGNKVDRQALPIPNIVRSEILEAYVAPRNPVEEVLAGIWCEVLKVEQVSIYDNFFLLGGHSLLATQVVTKVQKTLQVDLPLHSFFEKPTVANLAKLILSDPDQQVKVERIAKLILNLAFLSEDEVEKMVYEQASSKTVG